MVKEVTLRPRLKNGMERPSEMGQDYGINWSGHARIRMEHMTTKAMIGSMARVRTSVWFCGGLFGFGSLLRARVEMKMAPTPTNIKVSFLQQFLSRVAYLVQSGR
jgi:hypothetical protein